MEDILDLHGSCRTSHLFTSQISLANGDCSVQFSFAPIIYFFYPETSNISLEDIDKIFVKDGDDISSDRSSTFGDNDSGEMRMRNESVEKTGEKQAEQV